MRFALLCLAMVCCASLAAAANPLAGIPVTGVIRGSTGTLKGVLTLVKAVQVGSLPHFTGQIDNTVLKLADGTVKDVGTILLNSDFVAKRKLLQIPGLTLPLNAVYGTCDLLKLDIGAIKLNVAGLEVDLDAIHVEVAASGGTLGSLLCNISNLLGGSLNVGSLLSLLNNLISGLAGGLLTGLLGGGLLGGLLG